MRDGPDNTRTDQSTTSMATPLVQRSGDEVSAGDTTCDRSEAYEDSTRGLGAAKYHYLGRGKDVQHLSHRKDLNWLE